MLKYTTTWGVAEQVRGSHRAALKYYEKAVALKPEFAEARFNRATIDLLHGNFLRGWEDYEYRFKKKHWQDVYPLRRNLPSWDGSPFPAKRLLVYDEQGFGDTIQFARYLPQVKALGGSVILETRGPLINIMQSAEGVDEVIERTVTDSTVTGWDLAVSLLSLPGLFGTDLKSIPADIPYLRPPAAKEAFWRERIQGPEMKVGLVWAGNPDHENDHIRSIALDDLIGLSEIDGLRLFGLQKGDAGEQVKGILSNAGLVDLAPELEDFGDTAAVMANLDLIISVDTAAAHLAGALGRPVWTLVYFSPDWRWLQDRDDSPWYPTMRLFRQPAFDSWQKMIRRVRSELEKVVHNRRAGQTINPDAAFETATRLYQAGDDDLAPARLRRNLPLDPQHCSNFYMLGVAAYQKGDFETAKYLMGQALSIESQQPLCHHNYGLICAALGDDQSAIDAYRRAVDLKPDYVAAYGSLATSLRNLRRLDEALKLYDMILQIKPNVAELHHGRGQALSALGRYDQAIEAYQRAINLAPAVAKLYNSLGIAQGLLGDRAAALKGFDQALTLQPDLIEALSNMGTALQEQGGFEKAIEYFDRALHFKPDFAKARFNRGAVHLLKGNFEQGWRDYQSRAQRKRWITSHTCPPGMEHWDGSAFAGKRLCVHSEQGLGDSIHFIRYLPLVKNLGGTVILETSAALASLFQGLNSVDELIVGDSNPARGAEYDMCVHLLSLPGLFQTTLDTIPAAVPYIVADPVKAGYWRQKLAGPEFNVGLVWAGNPSHKRDRIRSMELARFGILDKIPGLRLYGLQKGRTALDSVQMAGAIKIQNFDDQLYDFCDTAALIDSLDLVVAVDTSVAHLAGAMGKPVWVMLPFVPDWRWMLNRDDSPWYPSMRLFRQPRPDDWDAVLSRVAKELAALVSSQ